MTHATNTTKTTAGSAALTSDITINGLMPTKREYDAHLRLLRELQAGSVSAWRATTLNDEECAAWIALHRHGIVETISHGTWNGVALTAYGRVYASQRLPAYVEPVRSAAREIAAYKADIYKAKRNARVAKKGGLR